MAVDLPEEIRVELERVVRRWQQLPLDRALRASADVRTLAQELADGTARRDGRQPQPLPDLGPATAMHQLQVTVWDAVTGAPAGGAARERALGIRLEDRLAELRRSLG